jgi:hypothetical protein
VGFVVGRSALSDCLQEIQDSSNTWAGLVRRCPDRSLLDFLAAQHEYYRDLTRLTEDQSLAGLSLDVSSLIAFGICYVLAMINAKHTPLHMRYMIGTDLIIMGPGIMRLIAVHELFGDVSFPTVVLYTYLICAGIGVGLLAYDLTQSRPYKPYLVAVGLTVGIYLTYLNRMSDWWLAAAGAIATVF